MPRGVGTTERVRVSPKLLSVEPPRATKAASGPSDGPELYEEATDHMQDEVDLMQGGGDRRKKGSKAFAGVGPELGVIESLPPTDSWVSVRRNVRASVRPRSPRAWQL